MSEVEDKSAMDVTIEEHPTEVSAPAVTTTEESKNDGDKQEDSSANANAPRRGIVSDASVLPKSDDHAEIIKQVYSFAPSFSLHLSYPIFTRSWFFL